MDDQNGCSIKSTFYGRRKTKILEERSSWAILF